MYRERHGKRHTLSGASSYAFGGSSKPSRLRDVFSYPCQLWGQGTALRGSLHTVLVPVRAGFGPDTIQAFTLRIAPGPLHFTLHLTFLCASTHFPQALSMDAQKHGKPQKPDGNGRAERQVTGLDGGDQTRFSMAWCQIYAFMAWC
jgi:hypothetical protein